MLIFRPRRDLENVPSVWIGSYIIKVVKRIKYLGHILTTDMKNDADIDRQRSLSIVGKMLERVFHKTNPETKAHLFKTYRQNSNYTCSNMCQL